MVPNEDGNLHLRAHPSLSPFNCNASLNVGCAVAVVRLAVSPSYFHSSPQKERRLALPVHLCAPEHSGGYTPPGFLSCLYHHLPPASPTPFRILRAVDAAAG